MGPGDWACSPQLLRSLTSPLFISSQVWVEVWQHHLNPNVLSVGASGALEPQALMASFTS
jgi:hypothetical protein